VVVDPRRTETARLADEHHFIRPGTDVALVLAMAHVILGERLCDRHQVMDGLISPRLTGWDRRYLVDLLTGAQPNPPKAIGDIEAPIPKSENSIPRSLCDLPRDWAGFVVP